MTDYARNKRGVLYLLLAMAVFVVNDMTVKMAAASMPPGQMMLVRSLFAVPMVFALIVASGETKQLRYLFTRLVLFRALFEMLVAVMFISALAHLPLADITAILQATPIFLTLIVAVFGIERINARGWLAVLVGFIGVLLVSKPTGGGDWTYSLIALGSAVFVAIRDLLTRRLPSHVPSMVVTQGTTLSVVLGGLLLAPFETWVMPSASSFGLLFIAAFFVTLGNVYVIKAYRTASVAILSPFRYSVIFFAVVLGFVAFGEIPDWLTISGSSLIIAAGLYTIYHERRRIRALNAPATEP
ncbi:DMT family transporter [Rhizobiales bacterium TNE-4]|nr:DMT family transporter [Rhizobiales bacterium TNE-4]MBV1827123.1 DMT family transporter [Rhizobiales bacterium TNE-4]